MKDEQVIAIKGRLHFMIRKYVAYFFVTFQLPYVGAAIGIVIASLGVVADALAYGSASYIAHPVLKALIVIVIGQNFLR